MAHDKLEMPCLLACNECVRLQVRAGINAIAWTPEGRRCLTGTNAGEFTLWQGQHFGFETILQVISLASPWAYHA